MINAFYRAAGGLLSPGGRAARLSILIYHRVLPAVDPLFPTEPDAAAFDAQMGALKQAFNVLPLGEAAARLEAGSLPPRAACVTFDDGYADNAETALPILQKHGIPAVFFIATAYLDGGRMFNDTVIHGLRHCPAGRLDLSALGLGVHELDGPDSRRRAVYAILRQVKYLPPGRREEVAEEVARRATAAPAPGDLMMDTAQLRKLAAAGMEIGAHTARHPILATLGAAAAEREIAEGKEWLEGALGGKVTLFAYPNGTPGVDYLPEQAGLVRRLGFKAAVSTRWGAARRGADLFQLPRFTPYSASIARFTPQLLQNLLRPA